MATTDWDFQSTRNEIIQRALRIVGALSTGEAVTGEQETLALRALNSVVKHWHTKRVFLWSLRQLSVSVTNGNYTFVLEDDPAVYAIYQAHYTISNEDIPIRIISWPEYQAIPNKSSTGEPCVIAVDNRAAPTAYIWPVLTTTRTIKYMGLSKLQDWDSAGGSADFPSRFEEALTYALAEALSYEYGLPLSERDLLAGKAERLFREAAQSDRFREDCEFVKGAY